MQFLTSLPSKYYFIALILFVLGWWLIMRLRRSAGIWRLRYFALPRPWLLHLHHYVPFYPRVPVELRSPYQDKVLQFVDGKSFRYADPMLLVAEDARVTIAGTACLLLLNDNGDFCFEDILAVQLWPPGTTPETIDSAPCPVKAISLIWDEENHRATDPRDAGHPALPAAARALGWEAAGRLQLPDVLLLAPWARRRAAEFGTKFPEAFSALPGEPEDMFAIATEMFYAAPALLQQRHPALFTALRLFYRVDTSRWKTKA